jgi:hypothetical protein
MPRRKTKRPAESVFAPNATAGSQFIAQKLGLALKAES